jgi:hypothetical protein
MDISPHKGEVPTTDIGGDERPPNTLTTPSPATTLTPSALIAPGAFGPFRLDIPEFERVAELRGLEVGAAVHGSDQPAIDALRRAEMDASMSDQALATSYALPRPAAPQDPRDPRRGHVAVSAAGRCLTMDASTNIDPIDHESVNALAACTGRPAGTLIALSAGNDPFCIAPFRVKAAEWFAALWQEHCQHRGTMHNRGIHYLLISLVNPPRDKNNVKTYVNTRQCFAELGNASRDARLLGLVPYDRIVDERNDAPVEHLPNYAETDGPASVAISDEPVELDIELLDTIDDAAPALIDEPIRPLRVLGLTDPPDLIEMPAEIEAPDAPDVDIEVDIDVGVSLRPPGVTPPWFHIELWCEKTTMNSILLAIAQERGLNVITGPGFQSLTGAWRLIERAKRSGRPVRILYISDFDKAGQHMPVAVARQIEFIIRRYNLDLDIQLIPVALTYEQCIEYAAHADQRNRQR